MSLIVSLSILRIVEMSQPPVAWFSWRFGLITATSSATVQRNHDLARCPGMRVLTEQPTRFFKTCVSVG